MTRLMLEKTSLGWLAWLHLKYLKLAASALQGDVFQVLTSQRSCSLFVCIGAGLGEEIRAYISALKMLIYKAW